MTLATSPREYTTLEYTRHGPLLYPRYDTHIARSLEAYGEYSPDEEDFFFQALRPGGIAVDAGAHIGVNTLALSRCAKEVHAFEPQRLIFQMLCANLALNECLNVHAYRMALGESCRDIRVPTGEITIPANTGGVQLLECDGDEICEQRTLDSLELHVDLLKADVEDMEIFVLRGARETIRRCRPVLYLESNQDHDVLIDECEFLGYKTYWHFPPHATPRNPRGNLENIWKPRLIVSIMLAAFPREWQGEIELPKATRGDDPIEISRKWFKTHGVPV